MIRKTLITLKKMSVKNILCLFDVDGTLTEPRKAITHQMQDFLMNKVLKKADVALVGGSDYTKISEQMGGETGKYCDLIMKSLSGLLTFQR